MQPYRAPLREQGFVLETIAELPALAALPGFDAVTPALVDSVLAESAKLAEGAFAPLNRIGDVEGATWSPLGVALPDGFKTAYRNYVEAGWNGLSAEPEHGGQGLPFALSLAVQEQFTAANMAFSLSMMLTLGAIVALQAHGSAFLKRRYLPKLVSGEWTGTMNMTEPQAGSDVGAVRTSATPAADGTYRVVGTKIYITWGEHDLSDNIVHFVLARLPDAPPGTRGISLFLVPKFIPDEAGALGKLNDLRCVSIEHKLGIRASPTCTMSFGDNGDCVAWLVGEPHTGMRAMFTMMNHARISVGLQGVAIAERAYQGALAYAAERVQSRPPGADGPARIIEHPDVNRMLMTIRATTEAARAIACFNAAAVDRAHASADAETRRFYQARADLLTPITKAYATDRGVEMASLAIQIYGGLGYIEEAGVAQHLRDARIAPIYEGTNGIQAMDLVGRKLHQDGGESIRALIAELNASAMSLAERANLRPLGLALATALQSLKAASDSVRAMAPAEAAGAGADYLRLFGIVLGACLLGRQAMAASTRLDASGETDDFLTDKIATAIFFADHILPQAEAIRRALGKPIPRIRSAS